MDEESFETGLTFLVNDLSKMLSQTLLLLRHAGPRDQKTASRLKEAVKYINYALKAAKIARDRR